MIKRSISQRSELIYDAQNFGIMIDTREIFLAPNYNNDIDETQIDHVVANQFIRNLRILDTISADPILIHCITCGGSWTYGLSIYDAIKNSHSEITILIHGEASSMSSIIPQAADQRILMPHASFHIHWGDSVVEGTRISLESQAEWSKKEQEVMLDIYTEKCKEGAFFKREGLIEDKQVREWLKDVLDKKQEIFMTGREAIDKGFADAILGDEGYETLGGLREE